MGEARRGQSVDTIGEVSHCIKGKKIIQSTKTLKNLVSVSEGED